MWIMVQNKSRMINTDRIIEMFVSIKGPFIICRIDPDDKHNIIAAEYSSREECYQVLRRIGFLMNTIDSCDIFFPNKETLEDWMRVTDDLIDVFIKEDKE